jgi:uncharacterized damage-inducible protein DinB
VNLPELFIAELDKEAQRSRRALEQMPEGKHDWKPHERSMIFGYLSQLVAIMPMWITMQIKQDEFDLKPASGSSSFKMPSMTTRDEYLKALDKAVSDARDAFKGTTDDHLMKPWRLLVGGNVVAQGPRHEMIRDTLNHLAHHRGQMTVYLRLLGAKVPALYGPSADDQNFA